MRFFLGAIALVAAIPAQAQYTISIGGTATYTYASNGGLNEALALYGDNITFSVIFSLDRLTYYPDPTYYGYEYWGETLGVSVNGTPLPNLVPNAEAYFGLNHNAGHPMGAIRFQNGGATYRIPGYAQAAIDFSIPEPTNPDIPTDLLPYLSNPTFIFLWLGANDGLARYDFTPTSFSLTGTRPAFDPNSVPEPAGWAMLIAGFGLAGATMRHRRPVQRRLRGGNV